MFALLLMAAAGTVSAAADKAPNIILALGDDTGWHGVGWHQSAACRSDPNCHMQTPRMDELVYFGIELDQVQDLLRDPVVLQ